MKTPVKKPRKAKSKKAVKRAAEVDVLRPLITFAVFLSNHEKLADVSFTYEHALKHFGDKVTRVKGAGWEIRL